MVRLVVPAADLALHEELFDLVWGEGDGFEGHGSCELRDWGYTVRVGHCVLCLMASGEQSVVSAPVRRLAVSKASRCLYGEMNVR